MAATRTWRCALLVLGVMHCSRTGVPLVGYCGNGLVEIAEQCDDGNDDDGDTCSNSCRSQICGDGKIDPAEQCDNGDDNEDIPALLLTHLDLWQPVMPVDRAQSPFVFYNYTSESSHTGFEDRDLSALFLYRDTTAESLGLMMHHGIDLDSESIEIPHGLVDMRIDELPPGVSIVVADDDDELFFESPTALIGSWEFWENTDGGAIAALPFPGDWSIEIRVTFRAGITRWNYITADGEALVLQQSDVAVLTAFPAPSSCRVDCTVPVCGDSYVDGGEVCDDGNTTNGDGCASDCRSLSSS
ncbi:DUF4215 domain-containing protein [Desulfobulbus sp. AH-315-M07]|nr:DUF4215 domain-containing protein [Desulfobulbus sp. AH-315-M07]